MKTEGNTMKKVLFATTALIATASVAAADVRISGYGRFGLDYNDANDRAVNGVSKTTITSRLRLQFDMSAETDAGVAFDARFRAQAESRDNTPGGATFNGARFGVSYQGFRVNVGNIIGAVENMPGTYLETRTAGIGIDGASFYSHVGNVNNEFFNWDAYSSAGTGVNGIEAIYSTGGFTGHLSYSTRNGAVASDRIGVMLSYNFGDWTVAAAHQSSDAMWEDKTLVSVAWDGGQFGARVAYADNDGISKFGIYGNMDIGASSNILLFYTDEEAVSASDVLAGRGDNRDAVAGSNMNEGGSYGIHYSYDLGGGASFEAGYRRASNDNDTFQAGVYFSF
ncbi:outer membrane porin [Ruegeria pomeroyi DSS-3]|jgi:outer membrane protein OmpU|uniref:Outer membrane porin n=2 Tax=Ruegeria pomeroyi TaxID=89184 RepID=Q5LMY2_RUEPO|nr:outer membrane porin [Ruegeria pomeroyi DSS-3]